MLSKCANPSCSTPFRYLREGQLFRFQSDRSNTRTEFFWLCSGCSETYKVTQRDHKSFVAVRSNAFEASGLPVEQEIIRDLKTESTEGLLEALKYELYFLQHGGYHVQDSPALRSKIFFRHSVTCLNYGSLLAHHACSECVLARFIPEAERAKELACHQIPLNEHGDTLAAMLNKSDPKKIETLVCNWLRKRIRELELCSERAKERLKS